MVFGSNVINVDLNPVITYDSHLDKFQKFKSFEKS